NTSNSQRASLSGRWPVPSWSNTAKQSAAVHRMRCSSNHEAPKPSPVVVETAIVPIRTAPPARPDHWRPAALEPTMASATATPCGACFIRDRIASLSLRRAGGGVLADRAPGRTGRLGGAEDHPRLLRILPAMKNRESFGSTYRVVDPSGLGIKDHQARDEPWLGS